MIEKEEEQKSLRHSPDSVCVSVGPQTLSGASLSPVTIMKRVSHAHDESRVMGRRGGSITQPFSLHPPQSRLYCWKRRSSDGSKGIRGEARRPTSPTCTVREMRDAYGIHLDGF